MNSYIYVERDTKRVRERESSKKTRLTKLPNKKEIGQPRQLYPCFHPSFGTYSRFVH
jgi:hypothetical protein